MIISRHLCPVLSSWGNWNIVIFYVHAAFAVYTVLAIKLCSYFETEYYVMVCICKIYYADMVLLIIIMSKNSVVKWSKLFPYMCLFQCSSLNLQTVHPFLSFPWTNPWWHLTFGHTGFAIKKITKKTPVF